jgi:hypothetical protein
MDLVVNEVFTKFKENILNEWRNSLCSCCNLQ